MRTILICCFLSTSIIFSSFAWGQASGPAPAGPSSVYPTAPSSTSSYSSNATSSFIPSIQQGGYNGSVPEGKATPGVIALSFSDALDRGLRNNLGGLLQ